jgi:hypothetical protein
MSITRKVFPFLDRGVQADSPHSSNKELGFSQQTQAIAFRCGGTTRHWVSPTPGDLSPANASARNCPYATVTAVDTWTDFYLAAHSGIILYSSYVVKFPWLFTKGFKSIVAYATVATFHDVSITFRVNAVTLVDAITEADGTQAPKAHPTEIPKMIAWMDAEQNTRSMYKTATFSSVVTPTANENRRIALHPQVMIRQDYYGMFASGIGGNCKIDLVEMCAMDIPDANEVG